MAEPEHWLWRLSAADWIAAARRELETGTQDRRAQRRSVTHARRAAGMALNAVLVQLRTEGLPADECESLWGRSYMDHLRAVADLSQGSAHTLPPAWQTWATDASSLCRSLLQIPVQPPQNRLVKLGGEASGPGARALDFARPLVELSARHCSA